MWKLHEGYFLTYCIQYFILSNKDQENIVKIGFFAEFLSEISKIFYVHIYTRNNCITCNHAEYLSKYVLNLHNICGQ